MPKRVPPEMFDKRLVFVTGKGGVGKSTVALALGLAAARQGKRTIVCEVSAQEHASRAFNRAAVGFHEVELAPGLWTISIDPDHSLREYVLLQVKVKAVRDLLFRGRVFTYLAAATPGLRELVTVGKIWELAQLDRKVKAGRKYDLVIVDAPATGHGLGFLGTARTYAEIARVGPIHSQGEAIHAFITNPKLTSVVLVAAPEEMPVNETAELERELGAQLGIAAECVYMNGMYPQRFSAAEAKALEAAKPKGKAAKAAIAAALTESCWAKLHRSQLTRLKRLVGTEVKPLPFIFAPELGPEELEQLAGAV